MDYTKLSRQVSYILRHHPEEYNIVLDAQGWCLVEDLLSVLRKEPKWQEITIDTLLNMITGSNKKRFEISDTKIRAFYGHSMDTKIIKKEVEPPMYLYHGTPKRNIESIKTKGIIPMSRQYVHLSDNVNLANIVGSRRDAKPVIIRVLAKEAWNAGVPFYYGNEDTWLSEAIPVTYLEFEY